MSNIITEKPPGPEFVFPAFDKGQFDASLREQSASVGKFGQKLVTLLGASGKNVFISPLSIHECLLMAGNGAMGSTLHSMKETLYQPDPFDVVNWKTNGESGTSLHNGELALDFRQVSRLRCNYEISAVCLDFMHPDAMMVLILPNAAKYLEPTQFSGLVQRCASSRIDLDLPKFEVECSEDLKNPLTSLGMGVVFSDAAHQVIHKTVLKVTENGVEATAVTAVGGGFGCARPQPPKRLYFNRPFIVVLADKRNDLIFFEGLITTLGDDSQPMNTFSFGYQ
ncbi:putative Serpin (serine protease inhibitor) [Blattamonas nauphoetae]|uniref:Serpin (Serine protease inhibitor) n=1 Tax=Blattamonas nauphoetae TaxID=2049346 RepID=A0ABQ9XAR9_9EUKA|nr:putative Serpin (serine protease inhibitor) [Blattamonas nauphoetae]